MSELQTAISRCAEYLPEGWQIQITVERGSAWAEIFNSDGYDHTGKCNLADLDLHEQIEKLLAYALRP